MIEFFCDFWGPFSRVSNLPDVHPTSRNSLSPPHHLRSRERGKFVSLRENVPKAPRHMSKCNLRSAISNEQAQLVHCSRSFRRAEMCQFFVIKFSHLKCRFAQFDCCVRLLLLDCNNVRYFHSFIIY